MSFGSYPRQRHKSSKTLLRPLVVKFRDLSEYTHRQDIPAVNVSGRHGNESAANQELKDSTLTNAGEPDIEEAAWDDVDELREMFDEIKLHEAPDLLGEEGSLFQVQNGFGEEDDEGNGVNLNDPLLLDILSETSVDLRPSQVSSQAPKGVKKARKHDFDFTDVVFTV